MSLGIVPSFSSFDSDYAEYGGKFSIGFGLLGEMELMGPDIGIEFGFLLLNRGYSQEVSDSITRSYTQKTFEIPILARYHFNNLISFGAGFYYGFYLGTFDVEEKNGNSNSTTINHQGYGDSLTEFTSSDFGLVFSLAGTYPLGGMNALLDIRRIIGLRDNDTRAVPMEYTSRYREWQFILGLQLVF